MEMEMGKSIFEVNVEKTFIGAGCNRTVNAAAWGPNNLVAFGVHNAVAIFCPQACRILETLEGHQSSVNCLTWLRKCQLHHKEFFILQEQFLLSGSADGGIILWGHSRLNKWRRIMEVPNPPKKAVTCITEVVFSASEALFASCSSDCSVSVWHAFFPLEDEGECKISFLQRIFVGSKTMVAVSLAMLPTEGENFILAMGGLDNHIHLHVRQKGGQVEFIPVCTLKGHQDWIRSLDFSFPLVEKDGQAIYLASSSQDKNIRIWKICPRSQFSSSANEEGSNNCRTLSLTMYIDGPVFKAGPVSWQVSLESLLIGHEDWVFSVRWKPPAYSTLNSNAESHASMLQPLSVLSSSMDKTMMVWQPDANTGLWVNIVTVGELSHSALGFYGGLWSPQGDAILAHGYGGSFHMWKNVGKEVAEWQPQFVPSGHSASVVAVAWAKTGEFLLSASHDKTTRLFAPWSWSKVNSTVRGSSWHEISRPQVHGHGFNCLAVLRGKGNHRYVSGAEEKVARVFEAPIAFLKTLQFVDSEAAAEEKVRYEDAKIMGANFSALGLSQKPIFSQGNEKSRTHECFENFENMPDACPTVLTAPPLEEHLAWNTLWPESHKLYGHGNELFSMCCDHEGKFLATACKAQTASTAEIWLWQVDTWRAVCRLNSHVLTVTNMQFSHDDHFLLSVSRDRHFSLFEKTGSDNGYKLVMRIEAHKRIIWTGSWSHCDRYFATGSRDKYVKIWIVENAKASCKATRTLPLFESGVTALAWSPKTRFQDSLLAVGTEAGVLQLWKVTPVLCEIKENKACNFSQLAAKIVSFEIDCLIQFDSFSYHTSTVNCLAWKECIYSEDKCDFETERCPQLQLASCGADHTVRVFNITCK